MKPCSTRADAIFRIGRSALQACTKRLEWLATCNPGRVDDFASRLGADMFETGLRAGLACMSDAVLIAAAHRLPRDE